MLKVVSNTTPIISLLKVNKLGILKELYKEVYIPTEVFNEIEKGKHKFYYQNLKEIDWIKIVSIKHRSSLDYFLDLDKGEAETIVLAKEINAQLVIIDEKIGRFYAKHSDLKITGTLGVLLKAKQIGIVKNIKPILAELKERGIWLNDKLINQALILAKEK